MMGMKIIIEIKITMDWSLKPTSKRTIKMVHFHKALTKSQTPLTDDYHFLLLTVLNLTNLISFSILVRFYVYRAGITVSVNVKQKETMVIDNNECQ